MSSQNKDLIDIKKIIHLFLIHWYWFFIAITLMLFGSYLFNRYSDYLYTSKAKVLIQQNKKMSSINQGGYNFDQFKLETNLNDEIMIIKSYPLILQTIEDLKFYIVKYIEGNIKSVETNESSFFIDVTSKNIDYGLEFVVESSSDDSFYLKHPKLYKEKFLYGEEIKIENTVFNLKKNSDFLSNHPFILKYPNIRVKFRNPQNIAREYLSNLSVERLKKDAAIVELSYTGPDKTKNVVFLNTLIKNYLNKSLSDKNKSSENTIKFIDTQLKETRDSLSLIERQLQKFKSSNNITNISVEAEHFYHELNEYEKEKASIKIQNKYFDYLEDYLHKQTDFQNLVIPVSYGIQDQMLNNMTSKLVELQLEKNLRNPQGNLENPGLKDLAIQINELSLGIIEVIKGKKHANKILLTDINSRIQLVQSSLNTLPKVERELININRLYDLSENIYLFLMQKRAEAGISGASSIPDAEVVEPALVETSTIKKPKRIENYLIGLLIGFLLPLLVFFILDFLDDKIMLQEDISNNTEVPFIGFVYKNHSGAELIVNHKPKSSVAESFRLVTSNINFFLKSKNKGNTILLTSSISGEGKTFCAKNLAVIYASSGKKTILIGADLRKPKLYIDFHIENTTGLSNYLAEDIDENLIINSTEIPNLSLINSGPIPPNPSELLARDSMLKLLDRLQKEYDYIIIDTPPIGIVADAIGLTQYCDLNIYTVRQRFTRKKLLNNLNSYNASNKINNLCVLLNDVEGPSVYGYQYGYSYEHYSGYYDRDDEV